MRSLRIAGERGAPVILTIPDDPCQRILRIVHQRMAPAAAVRIEVREKPRHKRLLRWEAQIDLSSPDCKKFTPVKEGDRIVDYQDVQIDGYLSTFKSTTESDRDGDYVEPGAFSETIPKFMRNPVLLVNHRNDVGYLVGQFVKMKEDKKGLAFTAKLSNSPESIAKDTRFKVAEGILRTASMGGLFHYKEDGRGIFKVDLWEGSLTPIPANPDALYSVREPTEAEMKKADND